MLDQSDVVTGFYTHGSDSLECSYDLCSGALLLRWSCGACQLQGEPNVWFKLQTTHSQKFAFVNVVTWEVSTPSPQDPSNITIISGRLIPGQGLPAALSAMAYTGTVKASVLLGPVRFTDNTVSTTREGFSVVFGELDVDFTLTEGAFYPNVTSSPSPSLTSSSSVFPSMPSQGSTTVRPYSAVSSRAGTVERMGSEHAATRPARGRARDRQNRSRERVSVPSMAKYRSESSAPSGPKYPQVSVLFDFQTQPNTLTIVVDRKQSVSSFVASLLGVLAGVVSALGLTMELVEGLCDGDKLKEQRKWQEAAVLFGDAADRSESPALVEYAPLPAYGNIPGEVSPVSLDAPFSTNLQGRSRQMSTS